MNNTNFDILFQTIHYFNHLVYLLRFYGRIAETPDCHDTDTLDAIRENVDGLSRVSGERIWMELSLILSGNFWGHLMETILKCGLGPQMGKNKMLLLLINS